MRILFINNAGTGYADHLEIGEGTTVEQFFKIKMPNQNEADYLIRVNRQPVSRDYIIQEGDRVTFTPQKIEGARDNKPVVICAKR
ncbi:MAG: molybdopterin converting factor [Planctomycetes bacterium GWF2_41_51]|nr:MAG: molybdopterin converting factor [Planctomycetes bacterium GWF2_41_51]HBG60715.1 molybdopterin converting factor [Candidatus Omnitrophota bacterium]